MVGQIKSKQRVNDFGEVYTNQKEVKAMCDLVPQDVWDDIDKTFLEPCCGNGNFLSEILERKFAKCRSHTDGLRALQSCYGIDIQEDNVTETRQRLLNMYDSIWTEGHDQVAKILQNNIICGDSLEIQERWYKESLHKDLIALAEFLLDNVKIKDKVDKDGKIVSTITIHDELPITTYLRDAINEAKRKEVASDGLREMPKQQTS